MFLWPATGFIVHTNMPATGALSLNLMGGAGMFAISIYTDFMGGLHDRIVKEADDGTGARVVGVVVEMRQLFR